ncbi:Peptidoglycan-binding Lysin subgroup [Penicillium coprophilum]|uniref:Peptidoglycan-binding Lysin subgroup n=1 Tax=Penicillium coprophilum TaxID=36646 RepID=UPI0023A26C33|nr:Peptidoglycan-binding Lysin subgroup [Penicillium coprophilum]KAJ5169870.1 Peptidoglycan-binding Lysin subgroup [Penicillium coprophilum]
MATAAAPVPTKDGFCFKYIIQGYDTCALIAQKHGITAADIESFNKDTWAWLGCRQLYQGDFICLSAGKPPMPMALPQATCGPQVPGTVRPSKWSDLAGLNPCPSSKCVSKPHTPFYRTNPNSQQCAFWGQCGVSELYCQKSGYRAPPAGPTATVKGATEAPKSPSTKTNAAGKPAGTGANSKSSAQSKTTKANTLKVTTTSRPTTTKATTSKKSTTKTTKWTPEPTVSQYPWNPPWQITMYSDLNCKGDYYHLEGYNHKFLDEKGCLALHGGSIASSLRRALPVNGSRKMV